MAWTSCGSIYPRIKSARAMLKSNIKRTSTMMKRLFPTALAVLLLLLAGCTAKPDTSDQSKPTDYYLTDTDLPLDDAARLRAAPDFLTAEQQTLYRQAFALYSAMFDGETTGIDDAFPAADGQAEYDAPTTPTSAPTAVGSTGLTLTASSTRCSPIRSGLPAMTTATHRSTLSTTVGFLSSTAPTATNITTATFPTNLL